MGFGECQITMWLWSAAPLNVKLSHKQVVVAHMGTAFLEINVTVHYAEPNIV